MKESSLQGGDVTRHRGRCVCTSVLHRCPGSQPWGQCEPIMRLHPSDQLKLKIMTPNAGEEAGSWTLLQTWAVWNPGQHDLAMCSVSPGGDQGTRTSTATARVKTPQMLPQGQASQHAPHLYGLAQAQEGPGSTLLCVGATRLTQPRGQLPATGL